MNILIVDDNETTIIYFKAAYKKQFSEINFDFANNYFDAMKFLDTKKYDKVISDFMLDKFTGIDILKKAKQLGVKERILFTAYSAPFKYDDCVTYFQRKPLFFNDLINLITKVQTNTCETLKEK